MAAMMTASVASVMLRYLFQVVLGGRGPEACELDTPWTDHRGRVGHAATILTTPSISAPG
jgi:hypothetical protein